MQNNKYISPLVVGFAAGILSIVPVLKSFGCCLIIPLAAFVSLMLDQKANSNFSKLDIKKGVIFGLITGLVAAFASTFFDSLITLLTRTNDLLVAYPKLIESLNSFPIDDATKEEVISLLNNVIENIKVDGFSSLYFFSMFFNNVFVNSVFGILGGIIGVQILNSRNNHK